MYQYIYFGSRLALYSGRLASDSDRQLHTIEEPVYNCMELVYPYRKLVYHYQRVCIDTLCVEAIPWLIYDSLMMVKFYQLLHGTRDMYWCVKMDKWERIVEENPIPRFSLLKIV